jgi:hypothetical protein
VTIELTRPPGGGGGTVRGGGTDAGGRTQAKREKKTKTVVRISAIRFIKVLPLTFFEV